MPLISAAPSDHLNLSAAGSVEVRGLAKGADLEFFHALDRSRDHSRGHAICLGTRLASEIIYVADGVTRHVVGVVATVNGKSVLIHVTSRDVASGRHSRLQSQQRSCVTPEIRQQLKLL